MTEYNVPLLTLSSLKSFQFDKEYDLTEMMLQCPRKRLLHRLLLGRYPADKLLTARDPDAYTHMIEMIEEYTLSDRASWEHLLKTCISCGMHDIARMIDVMTTIPPDDMKEYVTIGDMMLKSPAFYHWCKKTNQDPDNPQIPPGMTLYYPKEEDTYKNDMLKQIRKKYYKRV